MLALIIIFSILAYISIGIFCGGFWYKTLHVKWCGDRFSCGGEDSVIGFFLGALWPVSIILYFAFKYTVVWAQYLYRSGKNVVAGH